MPKEVIEVTESEIDGFVKFLEEEARRQKIHRFFLKHEDIFPLLADKNINRIRHNMKPQLVKRGIEPAFQGDGYYFTLSSSFNLNVIKESPKAPQMEISDKPRMQTFSRFKYDYKAPGIYRYVKESVARGHYPLIVGSPGTGKSRMFEEIAAHAGIRAIRRPLSQTQDSGELIGTLQVEGIDDGQGKKISVTKFVDGLITRCAREGMFCILDELDNATPAANEALKQISEDGANLVVETERGTEVVLKHANFRLCYTANTWCNGDSTGLFPNAQSQNRALMDRIRPKFELDYDEKIEASIVAPLLPKPVLDMLYRSDNDPTKRGLVYLIRETIKKNDVPGYLGLRSIIGFSEHYSFLGWNRSFLCNIIYDFPEDFRQTIIDVVTSKEKWLMPTMDDQLIVKFTPDLKKNGFVA
jgi:MoxR-like ATPase